jgi:hypothetical protein
MVVTPKPGQAGRALRAFRDEEPKDFLDALQSVFSLAQPRSSIASASY